MTELQPLDWASLSKQNLYVICHASYELERSCFVTESLPDDISVVGSLILATSATLAIDENYRKSLGRLKEALTARNRPAPAEIHASRSELMLMLRKAEEHIGNLQDAATATFLFDISVFPKDRLWVLVDLLSRVSPTSRVALTYTEPETYDTEVSSGGWLSKGVLEVISVPGFNGRQDPNKRSLLILNTGHENERMTITVNNREPNAIVLLAQGQKQHSMLSQSAAARIVSKLREDYGAIVDQESFFDIDSRDFLAVRAAIRRVYDLKQSEYNISVAFFGTKLQAIGALLACQENRRIEALYAQPQIYHRQKYSEGVGSSWMVAVLNDEPA